MPAQINQHDALSSATEAAILEAIRTLQFGSVEITIHDSRVVQIECKKKIRFPNGDSKEF